MFDSESASVVFSIEDMFSPAPNIENVPGYSSSSGMKDLLFVCGGVVIILTLADLMIPDFDLVPQSGNATEFPETDNVDSGPIYSINPEDVYSPEELEEKRQELKDFYERMIQDELLKPEVAESMLKSFEVSVAIIESKLENPNLSDDMRESLEREAAERILNIQILRELLPSTRVH